MQLKMGGDDFKQSAIKDMPTNDQPELNNIQRLLIGALDKQIQRLQKRRQQVIQWGNKK